MCRWTAAMVARCRRLAPAGVREGARARTIATLRAKPKGASQPAELAGYPGSAPAEFRSDVLEDTFDHVGVVVHAQLIRDREEQRVGRGDGLVAGKHLDEHVGLRSVRAAKDGPRVGVGVTDLVLVTGVAAKILVVAVVDDREDAAADGHAWVAPVSGGFPSLTIGFNLLALLDVQRFARLIILERRTLEIHAEFRGPLGRRVGTRAPPDSLAQSF